MDESFTDVIAIAHVGAAVAAIGIGIAVFAVPKGTTRHRALGAAYAGLVIMLDLAALSLHREAVFGPFHVLAILSLATIGGAVGLMIFTKQPPTVVAAHAFMMAWSYAGLLAAGMGQLVVQLHVGGRGWVWGAILATLLIAGVIIQIRMPRTLGPLLSDVERTPSS